jgi:hypothetical protein
VPPAVPLHLSGVLIAQCRTLHHVRNVPAKVDKLFGVLLGGADTEMYSPAPLSFRRLPLTIPFGAGGVPHRLGRMASDGEMVALRAAAFRARSMAPVLLFAVWRGTGGRRRCGWRRLDPRSSNLVNRLIANQHSAEIWPRIFGEGLSDTILRGRCAAGERHLIPVFIANVAPPRSVRRAQGRGRTGR